ncbi:MAG: hypothetical protein JWO62_54 [Acidimicrobiaceae bacterium]|nr:hypothetical protein [Acidimicrobiaceae bacterium]
MAITEHRLTLNMSELGDILGISEKHLRNHIRGSEIRLGTEAQPEEPIRLMRMGHRIVVPVAEAAKHLGCTSDDILARMTQVAS